VRLIFGAPGLISLADAPQDLEEELLLEDEEDDQGNERPAAALNDDDDDGLDEELANYEAEFD